jgi:hypothetical protein
MNSYNNSIELLKKEQKTLKKVCNINDIVGKMQFIPKNDISGDNIKSKQSFKLNDEENVNVNKNLINEIKIGNKKLIIKNKKTLKKNVCNTDETNTTTPVTNATGTTTPAVTTTGTTTPAVTTTGTTTPAVTTTGTTTPAVTTTGTTTPAVTTTGTTTPTTNSSVNTQAFKIKYMGQYMNTTRKPIKIDIIETQEEAYDGSKK